MPTYLNFCLAIIRDESVITKADDEGYTVH